MKVLRVVLVFVALAALVVAASGVSLAASQTPTPTVIKKPTKMALKAPTMSTAGFGGIYQRMLASLSPSGADSAFSSAVKNKAGSMVSETNKQIAAGKGKPSVRPTIAGMGSIVPQLDHIGKMPRLSGTIAKPQSVPGTNLKIAVNL